MIEEEEEELEEEEVAEETETKKKRKTPIDESIDDLLGEDGVDFFTS